MPRDPNSEAEDRADQTADTQREDFDAGKWDHDFGVFCANRVDPDDLLHEIICSSARIISAGFHMDATGVWDIHVDRGPIGSATRGFAVFSARHIGGMYRESSDPRHHRMAQDFLREKLGAEDERP